MGWLIYTMSGSKLLLGVVAAAGTAPMLFLSMLGGSYADRYPKRSILVCTQVVSMAVALMLALLIWLGHIQVWEIIALAAISGIVLAFDMPARQAFVIEMTSRDDLLNAISLNSSMFNSARIAGPPIAGLLIAQFGMATCFFLDGISFIPVIITLMMMRLLPVVNPSALHSSVTQHSIDGLRYVKNHPRALMILSLFAVVGVFGWSYAVLMPAIAKTDLGLSAGGYGFLMTASSIGALAGALTVAATGHFMPPRKLAFGGLWIFSIALILFLFCHTMWTAMPCLVVAGFGMMIFFSTSNTSLQMMVPDDMRGRVMGIWALVFGAMIPLGSLEAGALAHWIGSSETIAIGGAVCGLAAFIALMVIRRRERILKQQAMA